MPSQTCLVIGASRGIGYGLVEQLSADSSNKVIATVCKPFDFGKSNVETLVLDQSSTSSVQDAASKLSTPIDTLILNAAIGLDEALLSTSEDRLNEYLNTNILGVQRVVNAFLPALRRGTAKKIVIITSYSGSNTAQRGAEFGLRGPYAVTKTANNMQAVQLHNELRGEGFVVAPVHPGWVATDMGNLAINERVPEGMNTMPVEDCAAGLIKVIDGLTTEGSGKFWGFDGSSMAW